MGNLRPANELFTTEQSLQGPSADLISWKVPNKSDSDRQTLGTKRAMPWRSWDTSTQSCRPGVMEKAWGPSFPHAAGVSCAFLSLQ